MAIDLDQLVSSTPMACISYFSVAANKTPRPRKHVEGRVCCGYCFRGLRVRHEGSSMAAGCGTGSRNRKLRTHITMMNQRMNEIGTGL